MKAILEVFWKKNQNYIVLKIFLPYIVYLCLTFVYLVDILNNDRQTERDTRMIVIGSMIIILLIYLLVTESY